MTCKDSRGGGTKNRETWSTSTNLRCLNNIERVWQLLNFSFLAILVTLYGIGLLST